MRLRLLGADGIVDQVDQAAKVHAGVVALQMESGTLCKP